MGIFCNDKIVDLTGRYDNYKHLPSGFKNA